jgi:hypothetical protein
MDDTQVEFEGCSVLVDDLHSFWCQKEFVMSASPSSGLEGQSSPLALPHHRDSASDHLCFSLFARLSSRLDDAEDETDEEACEPFAEETDCPTPPQPQPTILAPVPCDPAPKSHKSKGVDRDLVVSKNPLYKSFPPPARRKWSTRITSSSISDDNSDWGKGAEALTFSFLRATLIHASTDLLMDDVTLETLVRAVAQLLDDRNKLQEFVRFLVASEFTGMCFVEFDFQGSLVREFHSV